MILLDGIFDWLKMKMKMKIKFIPLRRFHFVNYHHPFVGMKLVKTNDTLNANTSTFLLCFS